MPCSGKGKGARGIQGVRRRDLEKDQNIPLLQLRVQDLELKRENPFARHEYTPYADLTSTFEVTGRANTSDEVIDIHPSDQQALPQDEEAQPEGGSAPPGAGEKKLNQTELLSSFQRSLQEQTSLIIEEAMGKWWKYSLGVPDSLDSFNPFEKYSQSNALHQAYNRMLAMPLKWTNLSTLAERLLPKENRDAIYQKLGRLSAKIHPDRHRDSLNQSLERERLRREEFENIMNRFLEADRVRQGQFQDNLTRLLEAQNRRDSAREGKTL